MILDLCELCQETGTESTKGGDQNCVCECMKGYTGMYCDTSKRYSKQIMTGLKGNMQIYLPGEIQDRLPKSFY